MKSASHSYSLLLILIFFSYCTHAVAATGDWEMISGYPDVVINDGVAYGDGWIVVGDDGVIVYIDSQKKMTLSGVGISENIKAIHKNGTTLLAVGDNGLVIKSQDGESWSLSRIDGAPDLIDNIYDPDAGKWLVQTSSQIYSSTDLVTWTLTYTKGQYAKNSMHYSSQMGFFSCGNTKCFQTTNYSDWNFFTLPSTFQSIAGNDSLLVIGTRSQTYIYKNTTTSPAHTINAGSQLLIMADTMIIGELMDVHKLIAWSLVGDTINSMAINSQPVTMGWVNGSLLYSTLPNIFYTEFPATNTNTLVSAGAYEDRFFVAFDSLAFFNGGSGGVIWNLHQNTYRELPEEIKEARITTHSGDSLYAVGRYPFSNDVVAVNKSDLTYTITTGTKKPDLLCDNRYYSIKFLSGKIDSISDSQNLTDWNSQSMGLGTYVGQSGDYLCNNNKIFVSASVEVNESNAIDSRSLKFLGIDDNYAVRSRGTGAATEYYIGTSLGLYYSLDSGITWQEHPQIPFGIGDSLFVNESIVAVSHGNKLYYQLNNNDVRAVYFPFTAIHIYGDYIYSWGTKGVAKTPISSIHSQAAIIDIAAAQGNSYWTLHSRFDPAPMYNLQAVHYANGQFTIGTKGYEMLTSANGHDWAVQKLGHWFDNLHEFDYFDSTWFGVGIPGNIIASKDGQKWNNIINGRSLRTIEQFKDKLLVGGNHNFGYSYDGFRWSYTENKTIDVHSIAQNGDVAVAVGWGWGYNIYTSTNGISWTKLPSIGGDALFHVVWANGKFVAVGLDGEIATSTNGSLWVRRTSNITRSLVGLCWNGSVYVAVGDTGIIATSPDAASWTVRTSNSQQNLWSVTSDDQGNLVAVGDSNTVLYSSDNGVSWSASLGIYPSYGRTNDTLLFVEYKEGTGFVAASKENTVWFTHPDSAWSYANMPGNGFINLQLVNGTFFLMGYGVLKYSTTGNNWQNASLPVPLGVIAVIYESKTNTYYGASSNAIVKSTNNGATWELVPKETTFLNPVTNFFWDGDFYVAVAMNNVLYISPDLETWTKWSDAHSSNVDKMYYNGSQYLSINSAGDEFLDSDLLGNTSLGANIAANGLKFETNEIYWAVQDSIRGLAGFWNAADGDWKEYTGADRELFDIASDGSIYLAVGADGAIVSRPVNPSPLQLGVTTGAGNIPPSSSSVNTSSSSGTSSSSYSSSSNGSSSSSSENPVSVVDLVEIANSPQKLQADIHRNRLFYHISQQGTVSISIYNTLGQARYQWAFDQPKGNYFLELPALDPGSYVLRIRAGGVEKVLRLHSKRL